MLDCSSVAGVSGEVDPFRVSTEFLEEPDSSLEDHKRYREVGCG